MNRKSLAVASLAAVALSAACMPSIATRNQAVDGAELLEKDVNAAVQKLKELDAKLGEAGDKLKAKTFPHDLPRALDDITVPFGAENLDGKGVGAMPNRLLRSLLTFTSGAEGVNKQKEKLRNFLAMAEAPVVKAWNEEVSPVANFAVVFHFDGDRTVADLVPVKEPFPWQSDFPTVFTVTTMDGHRARENRALRWTRGSLTGPDLVAIPVNPKTTTPLTSEPLAARLLKALYDLREALEGSHDDPVRAEPGLIKSGADLAGELHKVAHAR